jgi:hypothetical protein
MDISIGMKGNAIRKLGQELIDAAEKFESDEAHSIDVSIYGRNNDAPGQEVTVQLSNDDMERPEVGDDEIYVEVSE